MTIRKVSPGGSGTGGGSWATAYSTVNAAINASAGNDEIEIDGGVSGITYNEAVTTNYVQGLKLYGSSEAGHDGRVIISAAGLAGKSLTVNINNCRLSRMDIANADTGQWNLFNNSGTGLIIDDTVRVYGGGRGIYTVGAEIRCNIEPCTADTYQSLWIASGTVNLYGVIDSIVGSIVLLTGTLNIHSNDIKGSTTSATVAPHYLIDVRGGVLNVYNCNLYKNVMTGFLPAMIGMEATSTGVVNIYNSSCFANKVSPALSYYFNNKTGNAAKLNFYNCMFSRDGFFADDRLIAGLYTDGGGNIGLATTNIPILPLFNQPSQRGFITFGCDDYVSKDSFTALALRLEAKGWRGVWCIDTFGGLGGAVDWAAVSALAARGHEIASHTRRHVDLDPSGNHQKALIIKYSSACTLTISSGIMTSSVGGLSINLASYTGFKGVTSLVAVIAALPGFTCSVATAAVNNYAGNGSALNLADITAVSIAADYTCVYDYTRVIADEILGSKQDIEANIPGYVCKTLVYPGNYNTSVTHAAVLATGYIGARGDNTKEKYTTSVAGVNVAAMYCQILADLWTTNVARKVSEMCNLFTEFGGFVAIFGHQTQETEIPDDLLDTVSLSNCDVLTTSQAVEYIRANGIEVTPGYYCINTPNVEGVHRINSSSLAYAAGISIPAIHETATPATDLDGNIVHFLPPSIGPYDGQGDTKTITTTPYAPTGYEVRGTATSPAKIKLGADNISINLASLTTPGTVVVKAGPKKIAGFVRKDAEQYIKGSSGDGGGWSAFN